MADESKLIENWIKGQIAKVHKKTGKAICPFAKKTIQDKTIQITKAKVNLLDHIIHCCHMIPIFRLDIVVLYIDYKISEQRLATICEQAHGNKLHMAVMYDHPDNKGLHKGVSFSYKRKPLVMIQPMDKLKDAQGRLRRSGWYEAWGVEDLEQFY